MERANYDISLSNIYSETKAIYISRFFYGVGKYRYTYYIQLNFLIFNLYYSIVLVAT